MPVSGSAKSSLYSPSLAPQNGVVSTDPSPRARSANWKLQIAGKMDP